MNMRVGIGYDSHRFGGKPPLKLGGVTIQESRGLLGHSDADVLLHALTDALLGAIGAPDIGELFPPSDPRYQGADSQTFLKVAYTQVKRRRLVVGNVDVVVIADMPKLVPYKPAIRQTISGLLEIHPDQVSVKGKTTEGFAPAGEGIVVHAMVCLIPASLGRHACPRKSVQVRKKTRKKRSVRKLS